MQEHVPSIPRNIEAEVAIIGCIFLDGSLMVELSDRLLPDDFYDTKNKLIYRTMLNLSKEGKSIDVTTVVSTLQSNHLLEQCGGVEYISSIADQSYSTLNYETYYDLISEASIKRTIINKLAKLSSDGYDAKIAAYDYVDLVEKEVFELSKRRNAEDFRPISEVSETVMSNTVKNANRSESIIGLNTGYSCLNKYTQGFQPGQLIILAARPSMGKSAMAMNLAVQVATKNNGGKASVAIFSLEMSAEQLVERMIACDSSIRINNIKNGRIAKQDWPRFQTSVVRLGSLNLYFDDSSDKTISSIRAKCRKLAAESRLDFIVIDYLQLIESDNMNAKASQQEKISKISRSLKLMARELNVPVLALSQLSRDVEKRDSKKPMMSDLRDSGSIEQDADIVLFLYREEYYKKEESTRKNEADLIISKNRSGATHEGLPFNFLGEYSRFTEMKKDE